MRTIFADKLQPEILKFIDKLTKTKKATTLVNSNGQKFVMIQEAEYRSWLETNYLLSSKKNAKVLKQALAQPLSECKNLQDVLNDVDS